MPSYVVGEKSPALHADAGSGQWCSAPKTMQYGLFKQVIDLAMDADEVRLEVGSDAVAQMRHYLENTGTDYVVDIDQMMARSDYLRRCYDEELEQARVFSQTLTPGTYSITSTRLHGGYFRRSQDPRYFFAIGGFSYWGQGQLVVENVENTEKGKKRTNGKRLEHKKRRYVLDFEFHFYDRYNWDRGKKTEVAGVTVKDEYLQELHRQCYAREYDVKGVTKKKVVWDAEVSEIEGEQRNPFAVLTN